jgi:hypothetical protein
MYSLLYFAILALQGFLVAGVIEDNYHSPFGVNFSPSAICTSRYNVSGLVHTKELRHKPEYGALFILSIFHRSVINAAAEAVLREDFDDHPNMISYAPIAARLVYKFLDRAHLDRASEECNDEGLVNYVLFLECEKSTSAQCSRKSNSILARSIRREICCVRSVETDIARYVFTYGRLLISMN